jgi:phosphate transport system substrate-binding protein
MKRRAAAAAFILALLPAILISGCARKPSEAKTSLTLAGSTSVQPFAEMLAEDYAKRYPDRPPVSVQGGGSSAGARAALTDAAQIGMLSRSLGQGESELTPVVIARDAIALVVHPSNPVAGLTSAQVRSIFSGAVAEWSAVGGPAGKIHVVSREEGSGTRTAFDELVMKGEGVLPRAIVQDSNGAVRETVAGDRMATGYISLGLVDRSVKALTVDGVAPAVETCRSGEYALIRPFLFAVKGQMGPDVRAFVDYVLGEDGQKILMDEGLLPAR